MLFMVIANKSFDLTLLRAAARALVPWLPLELEPELGNTVDIDSMG